jgi:hypothetical protein
MLFPLNPQHGMICQTALMAATGLLQPKMKQLNLTLHSLAKPRMPA